MYKIIKEIEGSFSSRVYLVERDGRKMVLKKGEEPDWSVTEKKFYDLLRANNIPALDYYIDSELKPGEMLLEYVPNSKSLATDWNENNCQKWGELAKRIHAIKYDQCFRYNIEGKEVEVDWGKFLRDKHQRSLKKAEEFDWYGFNTDEVTQVNDFVKGLFEHVPDEFCLIHGDYHTGNVLIRGEELVLFDREWDVFSGDRLYDLAIAWKEMPVGSLVESDDPEHADDLKYLEAFIDGYGWDFRNDEMLKRYVVLIAFSRLHTPFAKFYKEIIKNIVNK